MKIIELEKVTDEEIQNIYFTPKMRQNIRDIQTGKVNLNSIEQELLDDINLYYLTSHNNINRFEEQGVNPGLIVKILNNFDTQTGKALLTKTIIYIPRLEKMELYNECNIIYTLIVNIIHKELNIDIDEIKNVIKDLLNDDKGI